MKNLQSHHQDEARQATKQGRGSSLDTHNGCGKICRNSHSLCGAYFRRYAGLLQPALQNSTGRSCLHNCALCEVSEVRLQHLCVKCLKQPK